jgi:cytochrome c-type biogenesis protein CcmF
VGIGVFITGVTLVKGYESGADAQLDVGQSIQAGGYSFRFDGAKPVDGPNYRAMRATLTVVRDGHTVAVLHPEKCFFLVQQSAMTEAAIDRGVFRDLYVALGDQASPADDNATAWVVRVQVKPFVDWIWAGCLLMAFGGALAASDRRYRLVTRAQRESREPTAALALGQTQTQTQTAVTVLAASARETRP